MHKNPKPSSIDASLRMAATPQRDTSAEMMVRKRLHSLGFRYHVDRLILEAPRRKADISFPRLKIAVFIDGCFWHGCPQHVTWPKKNGTFWRQKIDTNRARDQDTTKRLKALGWTVVRIWEHEDPILAANKIEKVIKKKKYEETKF